MCALSSGGGVLGIVLPDSILNTSSLQDVRNFIKKYMIIDAVISLPIRSFKAVGANSKTSILFLHKKYNVNEKQPPIFMARALEIGFERKTKLAKPINENDLPLIFDAYKKYLNSKQNLTSSHIKICDNPSCFIINPELIKQRLDVSFFYAEYIFNVKKPFCRVKDVAKISYVKANLAQYTEIKYIQYGSIDKHVGSITNATTHLSYEAPGRAKYKIFKGNVLCAKMLDSEKNVAIIPAELDGQIASNGFIVLKPKPPTTSESLFVALRKESTTNQVRWKAAGTIMPVISDDDYLNLKIPVFTKEQIKEYTTKISQFNKEANTRKTYLKNLFTV